MKMRAYLLLFVRSMAGSRKRTLSLSFYGTEDLANVSVSFHPSTTHTSEARRDARVASDGVRGGASGGGGPPTPPGAFGSSTPPGGHSTPTPSGGPLTPPGAYGSAIGAYDSARIAPGSTVRPGAYGSAPPGAYDSARITPGSTGRLSPISSAEAAEPSGSAEQAVDQAPASTADAGEIRRANALKDRVTTALTNLYFSDRITDKQKEAMLNDDFEAARQASLWSANERCRELWWQEREALKKAKTNTSAKKD